VSAETIGVTFARSMGIEGTDAAALARLRALSSEQVLRGAPAANTPQIETTPILDGRLITETAETAYKARHQPRVPLLAGSNSADTAGNRIKATTKDEFFARFGKWSAQAKAAYDPDGTTELATMVSRANDDFGQAEPARFAASAFAANGSPAYLYRFSYVATAMRERMRAGTPHGGEIAFVFGTLGGGPGPASTPSPEDLAVSRMAQAYWVNFAKKGDPNGAGLPVWPRHDPKKDVIFDFRPDGTAGAGPDPRKARLDVTELNTDAGRRDAASRSGVSPAGSKAHTVECAFIGSGLVFAADLEARRVGEHASDLGLTGRRVPVPAPAGRCRECHRERRPARTRRRREAVREPARGSHDDDVVLQYAGLIGRLLEAVAQGPILGGPERAQHIVGRPEVPRLAKGFVDMRDEATGISARRVELGLELAGVSGHRPPLCRRLEIVRDERALLRQRRRVAAPHPGESGGGHDSRSGERG
jgi:hypothetical protein